jgi:hypothetical protein
MRKRTVFIFLFCVVCLAMCAGGAEEISAPDVPSVEPGPSAPPESPAPLWTGEGGRGIRLAVLAPELTAAGGQRLSRDEEYLPL